MNSSCDVLQVAHALFDEQHHPLDASESWRSLPESKAVYMFMRQIVESLMLDDSCLVIALIFIERAMRQANFVLNAHSWRLGVFMSFVVAMKVIFDEKIHLADCRQALPHLNLAAAHEQEVAFLTMIGYNTVVRRGQYAKYYYALQDVVLSYHHPTQ